MEDQVLGFETKQQLSHSDCLAVHHISKSLEELCTKFKKHHSATIKEIEQVDNLEEEQAIMDDQKDKIADLVQRIPEFGAEFLLTAHLVTPDTKPSHHLHR